MSSLSAFVIVFFLVRSCPPSHYDHMPQGSQVFGLFSSKVCCIVEHPHLLRLPGYDMKHVAIVKEFKLYFSLTLLYTAESGKDNWCFCPIWTKYIGTILIILKIGTKMISFKKRRYFNKSQVMTKIWKKVQKIVIVITSILHLCIQFQIIRHPVICI